MCGCVCVWTSVTKRTQGFCNNLAFQLIECAKISSMSYCIIAGGPRAHHCMQPAFHAFGVPGATPRASHRPTRPPVIPVSSQPMSRLRSGGWSGTHDEHLRALCRRHEAVRDYQLRTTRPSPRRRQVSRCCAATDSRPWSALAESTSYGCHTGRCSGRPFLSDTAQALPRGALAQ